MYYVHVGDASKILDKLNPESINIVFTSPSPPLSMGERMTLLNIMIKCKRVLTRDGVLWLQLGDYYDESGSMMGIPEAMLTMMKSVGYIVRSKVLWHRTEHYKQVDRRRFRVDYEFLYMFTKSIDHYFNDKLGLQDTSIVDAQIQNLKRGEFRSGFPEKLVEVAVKTTSRPGDFVLDPFAGTCTTGVVALKNKRNFIGIELREDTQEDIKKRLDKFDFCPCDV